MAKKGFKISQSITDRKDASLKLYFRDVSKLSLIDSDKEIELANRIKKGDTKAAEELINANLRFVISVAKRYQNKGLDLVDLIQEGNCGLIMAATKYNASKGYKFISYAVWWIRQAILSALSSQSRTVRIPICNVTTYGKISKITNKFIQENDRPPTEAELSEITNIKHNKIKVALNSNTHSVSLESPVKDEDSSNLIDVLANPNISSTDEETNQSDLIKQIDLILPTLSNRESDILRMIFGIGVPSMSNNEIANYFGIGSERVRQIMHKALDKIKTKYGKELINLL